MTRGPDDAPPPVLLYDGLCGFCDDAVQFALDHDRRGRLRFAPLQGDFAAGVLARHPELAAVDSLVLVESGGPTASERVRVRSDAALGVARELGGVWRTAGLLRVIPRGLRDVVYDWIARNRTRWFERRDACRVPDPAQRDRFLD